MIRLAPYDDSFEAETLRRIAEFFDFHSSLVPPTEEGAETPSAPEDGCRITLAEWQRHPSTLFVIMYEDRSAGFLRIHYRGPTVVIA